MTEMKTYTGGCHCGNVRFEVQTDLSQVIECNCSICSKSGYLLTFVTEKQFTLQSGQDALKDYQFNKKHVHHMFCTSCGIRPFGRGATPEGGEMYAINVRCLPDVDLSALKITPFDGKSL